MWTLSSRQVFKSQRISGNHMAQRINKQIGTVPAVEPEGHLVQVGLQMLGTDFVPCSDDAALEQRERRFNAVSVNISPKADVLFGAVIDCLMREVSNSFSVGGQFIRHDHVNIGADVF